MTDDHDLDHAEFAWRSVYGGRHVCIECAPTREAAVAAVDGQSVEDAGRAALAAQCVVCGRIVWKVIADGTDTR